MRHLNRRGFLAASAVAAASAARAQPRDTIRLGMGAAQVLTVDPIKLTQGVDNWAITHVFDLLARPPAGRFATSPAEYVPELAESWTISADARTWTFKLREGVQFHKGYGEFTADDVKFTFDRVCDPKSGSGSTVYYENFDQVQVDGKYTVRIVLKRPDPLFMNSSVYLTSSNIVCAKAVVDKGDRFALDPIGTGPYQMASLNSKMVRLTANDNYFAGPPVVPKMEIQYILDTSARALAILSGSVDMILAPAGPGAINSIRAKKPSLILDIALPGNSWSIAFNLKRKPFDQLKVRQAFMYAIDRDEISRSLSPPTPRVYGLNPPSVPGSLNAANVPRELRYDHDPVTAKALLAEAGFKDGFTFSAFCSARDDYASLMLIVQDQLRKVGVNMDLRLIDHAAFHADALKDLDSFTMRGGAYSPVPTMPFLNELSADGDVKPDGHGNGSNFSHYGVAIPGIDALVDQAMREPDLARRLALCRDIERKILTDLPLISLCTTAYVVIRDPRLDIGFTVQSGLGYWRLNGAKLA